MFSAYTTADAVAYPLAFGAVAAGVAAVDGATARSQIAFLALAFLAIFARVQYVVVPAAFVVAAAVVDRRRMLRTQRLPLVLLMVLLVAGAAVGLSRVLGYYSDVTDLRLRTDVLRWAGIDLFLLTLVAGVVIVPGAVVAVARPRGRTETAFAMSAVVVLAGPWRRRHCTQPTASAGSRSGTSSPRFPWSRCGGHRIVQRAPPRELRSTLPTFAPARP